jgi:hypothetical protein
MGYWKSYSADRHSASPWNSVRIRITRWCVSGTAPPRFPLALVTQQLGMLKSACVQRARCAPQPCTGGWSARRSRRRGSRWPGRRAASPCRASAPRAGPPRARQGTRGPTAAAAPPAEPQHGCSKKRAWFTGARVSAALTRRSTTHASSVTVHECVHAALRCGACTVLHHTADSRPIRRRLRAWAQRSAPRAAYRLGRTGPAAAPAAPPAAPPAPPGAPTRRAGQHAPRLPGTKRTTRTPCRGWSGMWYLQRQLGALLTAAACGRAARLERSQPERPQAGRQEGRQAARQGRCARASPVRERRAALEGDKRCIASIPATAACMTSTAFTGSV